MSEIKKGANVILVKDGKILILLRSKESNWKPVKWGPPGGRVDAGETPVQAAVRETFEESGLKVDPGDLIPLIQKTNYNRDMVYFYITDKFSGEEVKLSREHTGFTWIDIEKIEEWDTTLQPDELVIIKKSLLSF